jgi:hypothetical protein
MQLYICFYRFDLGAMKVVVSGPVFVTFQGMNLGSSGSQGTQR